jgi:signal transduction histidine kinase
VTRRSSPPWWPEGEPWPPPDAAAGPWRHGWAGKRRTVGPPFGCLFLLLGLFAAGAMIMAIWAVAAIVGAVEAPPIVVAAGIVAFVLVIAGAAAALRAFRRISEPLDRLIEAAGRVEAGDYSVRVPVSGTGEMRSLARSFNQMTSRLEAADTRRRAFLADVAHELRTPLTVLQGQLEAIADGIYPADRDRLAALLAQTASMARLVEDLRTISLAEVGGLDLRPIVADVVPLLEEVVMAYAEGARQAGIGLTLQPTSPPIVARFDVAATRRILANLVTNAIRHTPPGGKVGLSAGEEPAVGRIAIAVRDTGSGIPPELIARVFDRFVKSETSTGSGLGLPIARDLVEAMGGSIELTSRVGEGTTVMVRLPRGSSGEGA